MLVDFACYLFHAYSDFSEDDHVGIGCSNLLDGLLNATEVCAPTANERVVKKEHHVLGGDILINHLNELLVDSRTLDYVQRPSHTSRLSDPSELNYPLRLRRGIYSPPL